MVITESTFELTEPVNNNKNITITKNSVIFHYPCDSFSSCTSYRGILPSGNYVFETWGAQGGYSGGHGGYSKGLINIQKPTQIYIFIGAQGQYKENRYAEIPASFNGGGRGNVAGTPNSLRVGSSGGGGTDIRVLTGSLYNRIIVSGGGGGSTLFDSIERHGGSGGGKQGVSDEEKEGIGGTQTESKGDYEYNATGCEKGTYSGKFGYGGQNACISWTYGGGGGGWYGGTSGSIGIVNVYAGSGGSGYVLTSESYRPSEYFKEYEDYLLSHAYSIDGDHEMPKCEGEYKENLKLGNDDFETGHKGNGCVRITQLKRYRITYKRNKSIFGRKYLFSTILISSLYS